MTCHDVVNLIWFGEVCSQFAGALIELHVLVYGLRMDKAIKGNELSCTYIHVCFIFLHYTLIANCRSFQSVPFVRVGNQIDCKLRLWSLFSSCFCLFYSHCKINKWRWTIKYISRNEGIQHPRWNFFLVLKCFLLLSNLLHIVCVALIPWFWQKGPCITTIEGWRSVIHNPAVGLHRPHLVYLVHVPLMCCSSLFKSLKIWIEHTSLNWNSIIMTFHKI